MSFKWFFNKLLTVLNLHRGPYQYNTINNKTNEYKSILISKF